METLAQLVLLFTEKCNWFWSELENVDQQNDLLIYLVPKGVGGGRLLRRYWRLPEENFLQFFSHNLVQFYFSSQGENIAYRCRKSHLSEVLWVCASQPKHTGLGVNSLISFETFPRAIHWNFGLKNKVGEECPRVSVWSVVKYIDRSCESNSNWSK